MNAADAWTGRTTLAIAATMSGQGLGAAAQLAPAVLAIEVARHSGLPATMIGVYTGLVFLAAALTSLGGGGLIGRYGGVTAVQAGLLLSAAGAALAAVGSPWALALSAVVIGAGYGPMTPASSVVLARWAPARRLGLVMSIKQTGVPLGYFATGVALPPLADGFGWQASLLGLALISVAASALLTPAARLLDERGPSVGGGFTSARQSIELVRRPGRLRRIAFASLAFAGVQVSLTSFLVVYLEADVGFDKAKAAWPLAVAGVAAVAGRILWGWLADYTNAARLLALLPLAMAGALALLLSGDAAWGYGMLTLLGMAAGFSILAWNGVMLIETARQAPAGQIGLATSGVLALTFLGSTIFPQALSFLVGALGGYGLGFGSMILVCLAVACAYAPDAFKKS